MQNIIKALNFKTLRDNVTYYAIIAALVAFFIGVTDIKGIFSLTGSEYFIKSNSSFGTGIAILFVILATRICGWDFADKTLNYEALIGHKRSDMYFGRVIVAMAWCIPIALAILVLPPLVLTIMNGWGVYMDLGGLIIRCIIALFPIMRILCECVLLTFLTKSCYLGLIVSFLYNEIGGIIITGLEQLGKVNVGNFVTIHSFSNFSDILTFENYNYEWINGEDITVFETALDPLYLTLTVVVSLLGCAACILLGWHYFKKSDLN